MLTSGIVDWHWTERFWFFLRFKKIPIELSLMIFSQKMNCRILFNSMCWNFDKGETGTPLRSLHPDKPGISKYFRVLRNLTIMVAMKLKNTALFTSDKIPLLVFSWDIDNFSSPGLNFYWHFRLNLSHSSAWTSESFISY